MGNIKIAEKSTKTVLSVFKRQMHVLALVQHGKSSENMNCNTIADLISDEPGKEIVSDKMVRDSVTKLKGMGFPIEMDQGAPRVSLTRELSDEEMLEVLPHYLNVVTDTVGIRDCFKSYVEKHKSRSLWIMARIYFATLNKKQIELTYRPVNKAKEGSYTLKPYRWIYRDNAVYLIARNVEKKKDISLYRINRIKDLRVTDIEFDDDIPPADELLRCSMGAFISSAKYMVKLEFPAAIKDRIEEDFGHLKLEFSGADKSGKMSVKFTVCDLINICKAVFGFAGEVKIVEPKEAVAEMKRMLGGNNIY